MEAARGGLRPGVDAEELLKEEEEEEKTKNEKKCENILFIKTSILSSHLQFFLFQ